jgi:hypothetical protein
LGTGFLGGTDHWRDGDGRDVQYRIETVYSDTADTLIFRNEDAGFLPPYFKFDSADLQSVASRITRECPEVAVTVHGYSLRIPWLDMFPNATSIDAPQHCIDAPSDSSSAVGAGPTSKRRWESSAKTPSLAPVA